MLAAVVAVAAGIYAGVQHRPPAAQNQLSVDSATENKRQVEASEALKAVQAELAQTTLFPLDFKTVPPFALLQGPDKPATEALLDNQWSMMFFGFTNCPDVCPITLNEMNGVVNALSENENASTPVPQVMFITVDPARDTVEKTAEYTAYFNENFIGVSGDLAEITRLTSTLGIVASYTASETDPTQYSVDHTASLLLVDPERRIRAKFNPPHTADSILSDYNIVMSHFTSSTNE